MLIFVFIYYEIDFCIEQAMPRFMFELLYSIRNDDEFFC